MSYKSERDKAAEEYQEDRNAMVEAHFKAGADWTLQSEVIKKLYRTAQDMHSCVSADPCESELAEVEALGMALEAYEKAVKEVVNE